MGKAPLHLIISLLLLTTISCKKDSAVVPVTQPPLNPPSYQLVWSDEFDGTVLNAANWNFETGGSGWGNNEQEYYQSNNTTVMNGSLLITAKKETAGNNNYTSSRITTLGKREFTYGKIEGRIKIPAGQGLWPAFWLLGANIQSVNWPLCGETDILEHINADNKFYGTMHWEDNGHASYGGSTTADPAEFHVYSIEWDYAAIRWYVDGVKFHEANILNNVNSTEEFHKPFFIILNLAVGGDWPGQVIDDSKLPATLEVDYVRVYQK